MDIDRLVYIIAATFGLDYRICTPARDLEAEGALTRALARSGGDGLTACHEDAGVCPKPCLRHRRVNVGIWPNWRCRKYRRWDFESENCRPCLPDLAPRLDCGTYQDHIANEELKRKTAAYIQNRRNQEWDGAQYQVANENAYSVDGTPSGASGAFGALLDGMVRQSRNISDNMGISTLWDREPDIIIPPDTTWYAQYPEQKPPQFVASWPFWRARHPLLTDPPPAESPQPSAAPQPSLDAALHQPVPDSEV